LGIKEERKLVRLESFLFGPTKVLCLIWLENERKKKRVVKGLKSKDFFALLN
jgi:hypothetical protein